MPVALNAFHWQPVRKRKKIASMHTRSGTGGRPPPVGWVLTRWGISGWIFSHNASETRKRLPITDGFALPLLSLLATTSLHTRNPCDDLRYGGLAG